LRGEVTSSSPSFLGADPAASALLGGHLLRPLGAAEDLARELVRSLDEGQAAEAMISPVAPVDIVGGNRAHLSDGDTVMPLPDVWRGGSPSLGCATWFTPCTRLPRRRPDCGRNITAR